MIQISQILEGWGNLVQQKFRTLSPALQAMAEERLLICHTCPARKYNMCNPLVEIKSEKTGEMVKGCGCSLAAKTLVPSAHCPAYKWDVKTIQ